MKKLLKSICIFAVAATSVACMDLYPKDQMSDVDVWGNAQNTQLFANQFYGALRGFHAGNYRSVVQDGPHSDKRSDLIATPKENEFSAGKNQIPATDANYTDLYSRIYRTNLLLANVSATDDKSPMAQPIGEAYFFRAYLHFELVQLYGDVILVQTAMDVNKPQITAQRDNRLVVINAIIEDLKAAANYLPETPSEEGRVCKQTAWAMLSRVALYEGSWQKFHVGNGSNTTESVALFKEASAAAEKVMISNQYQLFYNADLGPRDSYRYMFILEDAAQCNPANLNKSANTEYILAKRYNTPLKYIEFNITHGMLNHGDNMVTAKMADMYRCQDGLPISKSPMFKGYATATSEFENRDNRMNATLMMHGQKHWDNDGKWRITWDEQDEADGNCKVANNRANSGYANYKWCTERQLTDAQESYDFPVIRYAEVLLNYAEAKYEEKDEISDADLDLSLNLVRARTNPDMTKLSNQLVSANGLSMREEIRAERTVELFEEGFRLDDLKRWKTAEIEMPMNQEGIMYEGTWFGQQWTDMVKPLSDNGRILMWDGRVWDQKHYLYPLSSDQTQLNPNLGQNPGWE